MEKGSRSGTIIIEVIGDAFATGKSLELWMEMHQDDVVSDILVNEDSWWTTILIGRS